LYRAKGDIPQALAFMSRYSDVREHNLSHNLLLGSERQKLTYLERFAGDTNDALSLHAQLAPREAKALRLAFSTLLRRKGRGLDATADNIATLRRRAGPQDQALFAKLAEARSQLAALTLKKPEQSQVVSYPAQLKKLAEEVDRLETEVSARSAEFRSQSQP